ncbi:hypothetical protein [Planotetraspora kaengkrachanensis]|uniref:Adenylate kinase n=1 Tax=Planotetraspora kaengkrachanensis TaxID=575193 RepID=A0A8J3Q0M1_9ACTN|nr:hypothetical protein [Planotetraspora kaengkrachanensis]GIG84557.1 adenylate kinase [Planotetraspora kaengkrachanensis]
MGGPEHGTGDPHPLPHGRLAHDPAADEVAAWLRGRPPRAHTTRVLSVEGRSGAGKSTFAAAVAAALGAATIRMDDLYDGWDGLSAGKDALLEWVLRPLASGAPARWRRYDWDRGEYAEWHEAPSPAVLVVEGVGSGALEAAPYLSGLVWLEAVPGVRRARALARDGDVYAPHWRRWARQEDEYYAADDVRSRADLIIDTG